MRNIHQLVHLPVLVLVSTLYLVGCGQNRTPAEYVAKANAHFDKGDFQAASIELSNALQVDPKAREARWLMAKVAIKQGDGARAEKEVRKAIEFGHSRTEARPTLVKAILLQGDLDRVISETATLPADTPVATKALLLAMRGQALLLKGQFDQARPALEQALEIDPKATQALIGKAALHAFQREYDEARRWLKLALETDANSSEAWSGLGELELAQDKPADAAVAFGNAIKLSDYPTLDRAKRALARLQLGNFEEAEADIQALRKQNWNNHPYVNYVAGLVFFRQKKYPEAAAAFEASYAAEPGFLPNRMYLATTRLLLGETAQALSHAQHVYSNARRSPAAARLLGAIQVNRSDYAAAQNVLQTALRTSPKDGTTLRMLATVSLLEGDVAKGMEYSRKVAALEPQSREAQDLLMAAKLIAGESLGKQGKNGQAAASDDYTREFLLALEAFRNNQVGETLERANKLHAQYPDKVDPLKLIAACYLAAGQWDAAKVELAKVLQLEPNEPSATRNLAKVEAQGGNSQRAQALLQELLKQQPGDEEAALLLAEIETKQGNLPVAIGVLEQAVQRNPIALEARTKLAAEYLRTGMPAKVLEVTEDLSPAQLQKHPALLELRGKAQMLAGDLASARTTFEQWTKAAPDSVEAHFYYSDGLARGGDRARARKALERAVQLDAKYLPARVGEIKMLVQFGELEKAKKALAKLRPDFGERPEVLGIEGWFALGAGDYATAEQRFSAALKQRPDAEMTVLLTRALWVQKKHDRAIEVLQAWIQGQPQDVEMLLHLAGAYMSLEKNDEAIATYANVVKISPNHIPALNNLAWLNRDKDPQQAMEYAHRAYRLAPADPTVLDTLAILTLKSGDVARAYNLAREAATLAPEDPQIQLHLGGILVQQQRLREARQVLTALVKKAPNAQPGKEAKTLLDSISGAPR